MQLWRSSIAIEEDAQLAYTLTASQDRLSLAETYATCQHLFRDRGKGFDDWKGAFAFSLALKVPRATRRRAYLFNVMNFRSGVEYTLRKVVEPTDQRLKNPVYYPPDETEFSRAEINRFIATFVGYLEGYCESLATRWTERFLLAVESNLILFGFDGEKFFTRGFQDPEEFGETRATLAKQLPTPGFYPRAR